MWNTTSTGSLTSRGSVLKYVSLATRLQVKVKGARKISFAEFRTALELVAEKKVRIDR
jgi:hypothetical protein